MYKHSVKAYRKGLAASECAWLTVDLNAIARNYRKLCTLAPGAEVMATVKADAYGLGVEHVAPALVAAGCKAFFVALVSEGADLRRILDDHGLSADIYVLNGFQKGSEAAFGAATLYPVLNSMAQIADWQSAGSPMAAALHIDTGMNRLGLSPEEAGGLEPKLLSGLNINLVMSHLACADEPNHPKNEEQRKLFETLSKPFGGIRKSLCNSAGILLGDAYHGNVVRPGIALYGGAPQKSNSVEFEPVVTLSSKILQVRQIDKDQTVGYGATHRASAPTRVATLGLGYADGYRWGLGGKARGFLAETGVPVLGRISMDLTTIDVSGVAEDEAQPGAVVTLLNDQITINEAAELAGTIPYEIITGLGSRFHRTYENVDSEGQSVTVGDLG